MSNQPPKVVPQGKCPSADNNSQCPITGTLTTTLRQPLLPLKGIEDIWTSIDEDRKENKDKWAFFKGVSGNVAFYAAGITAMWKQSWYRPEAVIPPFRIIIVQYDPTQQSKPDMVARSEWITTNYTLQSLLRATVDGKDVDISATGLPFAARMEAFRVAGVDEAKFLYGLIEPFATPQGIDMGMVPIKVHALKLDVEMLPPRYEDMYGDTGGMAEWVIILISVLCVLALLGGGFWAWRKWGKSNPQQ